MLVYGYEEMARQIKNRDELLAGVKPLEAALSDNYSLTVGLGKNVGDCYRSLLRSAIDLTQALERLSMEYSTVKARVYADRRNKRSTTN